MKKAYIFAHMSVQAWGVGLAGQGGGLKALADISAKNVNFLDGSHKDDIIKTCILQ